jgi:hypothetical protein
MPASPLPDLPPPLALICHDAGAANLIFAWVRASAPLGGRDWRVFARGPALRLWEQGGVPDVRLCASLDEALDGAETVVSGTGWASDLEHDARKAAQARGLLSLGVIDHWVNYPDRFVRHGETVWPERFVVTDEYAEREAKRYFPGQTVLRYSNLYLQEQVAAIAPAAQASEILYVLEPLRGDWIGETPGEFQALDFFINHLNCITAEQDCPIRLRPHPSDPPGKYTDWIAAQKGRDIALDARASLAEAISHARWVVGAETFAMVVALAAGRRVFSTLPPWGHRCRLPHPLIAHLRDFPLVSESYAR